MQKTQHLTASDLMIGDWVKVTDDDSDEWFFGIACGMDRDNVLVVKHGDSIGYPYAEECVQPIPLTPEILEKNGFTNEGFFAKLICGDYTILCDGLHVAIFHKDHTDLDVPIQYLHELQHCLRLCQIDKEIVL